MIQKILGPIMKKVKEKKKTFHPVRKIIFKVEILTAVSMQLANCLIHSFTRRTYCVTGIAGTGIQRGRETYPCLCGVYTLLEWQRLL